MKNKRLILLLMQIAFIGSVLGQTKLKEIGTDAKSVKSDISVSHDGSKTNSVIEEGFEIAWTPTGWTLYSFGDPASWNRSSTISHSGLRSAYHNNTNVTTLAKDWLVSPAINVTNTSYELSFWQYQDRYYYYYNHKVVIMNGADPATAAFLDTLLTGPGTEDTWTYHDFSLAAYNGQTIYIGFYYEGDSDDRWYIDDFSVNYPENNDATITSIVSPVDNFFPKPTEIIASLANAGVNTFTSCDIVCNIIDNTHGGTVFEDTIPWIGSLAYKDTVNINLGSFSPLPNTNYIVSVNSLLSGDEDNTNDYITLNIYSDSILNQFPYTQDFENAGSIPNYWQMGGFEDWIFDNSVYGGAQFDHTTGTGYLAGLDDSGTPNDEDMESFLLSPVFDFSSLNNPYLSFYYLNTNRTNSYPWISQLHIDITTDGKNWTNDLLVITQQIYEWTEFKVYLSAYNNDTVQLRFRGITETGSFSSPSLDDVYIGEMPENDLKTTMLFPNGIRYHNENGEKPRVVVYNEGSAEQTNYKVYVTVTDTTTGTIVYMDSTTNQTNIASLDADTLSMPTTWNPDFGFYQLKSYVSIVNDENHSNDTIYETLYKSEWYNSDSTLPMTVFEGSSVAYSGTYGKYLFSIAGNTEDSDCEVFAYDIENNTWIQKANLPYESKLGSAAVYGDKIFVQNGKDGPDYTDSCFSYDIATDVWTPIANLPIPTAYTTAATLGNSIYVAGGIDDYDNMTDSVFRYDIQTNTWHRASNLPMPMNGGSLINIGDKLIYVWGEDYNSGKTLGKAIIGQVVPAMPDSIIWTISSDSAEQGTMQIQAAPLSNNALIVTSGLYEYTSSILSNTYIYYLSTDTWVQTASKPVSVYGYAAGSFVMNDSVRYITAGGFSRSYEGKATASGIDIVEYYQLESHIPSPETLIPAENASNIATNALLSITFDVDVDTMFTPLVTITDGVNLINVTAVVFNEASNTLEISHDLFDYATTYTVTIQAGAFMSQKLDGSLNEEISWSFTSVLPAYTISFSVDDGANPIDGATIAINDTTITTNASGLADIQLQDGIYDYTISKSGFQTYTNIVSVNGSDTILNIQLTPIYLLTFTALDGEGMPLENVNINIAGQNLSTNNSGIASIELSNGSYPFSAHKSGYQSTNDTVFIEGSSLNLEITLLQLFEVNFGVENGSGGSLEATVNAVSINSGDSLPQGSQIIFSALPQSNYHISDWIYNGIPTGLTTNVWEIESLSENTSVFVVFAPDGINERDKVKVKIYPNPTDGLIMIETEDDYRLEVSSTSGETIYLSNLKDKEIIDISKHAAGIYYIRLTSSKEVLNYSIILK